MKDEMDQFCVKCHYYKKCLNDKWDCNGFEADYDDYDPKYDDEQRELKERGLI